MFELGVLGLCRALERGALAGDWTLHAVGAERRGRRLDLGGGDWMQLLPAATDRDALLRGYDVGLAPLHGAAAGARPARDGAGGHAGGDHDVRAQEHRGR